MRETGVTVGQLVTFKGRRNYFAGENFTDATAIEQGTVMRIRSVEMHGSNPWTRYAVSFEAGGKVRYSGGMVAGKDF